MSTWTEALPDPWGRIVGNEDLSRVELLGVRFPRISQEEAVEIIRDRIARRVTSGICFPDMSTLNLAAEDPSFLRLLRQRFTTFNDGAGLALAAWAHGAPFPANLNGTDLCPRLLAVVPEGTRVFLIGGRPGVADRARARLAASFPRVVFAGHHHGYLEGGVEERAMEALRAARPDLVFVGMGNPRQVQFIDRHLDDPALSGTVWLGVGGFLDYHGGGLRRAPPWLRRARLEWAYIVGQQPHKARRYFIGIPKFLGRCALAEFRDRTPVLRAEVKSVLRAAAARAATLVSPGDPDAPRILCYHGVADRPDDEWSVSTAGFREQMRRVVRERVPVPLDAIRAWMEGAADLPPRALAVTFDDGYVDVLDRAAPILAELGIPAAAFVSPDLVSRGPDAAAPGFRVLRPLMNWSQVQELAAAGWTIGSHALDHAPLARLSAAEARRQVADSRRAIEDRIGREVRLIAYPFGTPAAVSVRDRDLAREAGYDAGFLAVSGSVAREGDRFAVPRCKLLGTDGARVAGAVIRGDLDAWRFVERLH